MPIGTVHWFNPRRGYGFITPQDHSSNIYVHSSDLQEPLEKDQWVEYEVERVNRGPRAKNVRLLAEPPPGNE